MVKKQLKYKWKQRVKVGDKIQYLGSSSRVLQIGFKEDFWNGDGIKALLLVPSHQLNPVRKEYSPVFTPTEWVWCLKGMNFWVDIKKFRPYGS